jgi:hypothetical protein
MPPVRVLVAFFAFSSGRLDAHTRGCTERLGRLLESIGGSSARRGPEPTEVTAGDAAPGLCRDETRSLAARDAACRFSTVVPLRRRRGVSYGFPEPLLSPSASSTPLPAWNGEPPELRLLAWPGPTEGPAGRLRPSSSATPTGDLRLPPDPLPLARPSYTALADRCYERSEESTGGPIKTWRAFRGASLRSATPSVRAVERRVDRADRALCASAAPCGVSFEPRQPGRAVSCRNRRRLTAA